MLKGSHLKFFSSFEKNKTIFSYNFLFVLLPLFTYCFVLFWFWTQLMLTTKMLTRLFFFSLKCMRIVSFLMSSLIVGYSRSFLTKVQFVSTNFESIHSLIFFQYQFHECVKVLSCLSVNQSSFLQMNFFFFSGTHKFVLLFRIASCSGSHCRWNESTWLQFHFWIMEENLWAETGHSF